MPEHQPGYQAIAALTPESGPRTGLLPDLAAPAGRYRRLAHDQDSGTSREPPGPAASRQRAAATSCSITRQAGT